MAHQHGPDQRIGAVPCGPKIPEQWRVGHRDQQPAPGSFRVTGHPRVTAADTTTVAFADGTTITPAAIVWATGYRSDYSYLDITGAVDDAGAPIHQRGVSPVPGLYFLGLPWQHTRGSALLGFVGADAAHIAEHIATATTPTPAPVPAP